MVDAVECRLEIQKDGAITDTRLEEMVDNGRIRTRRVATAEAGLVSMESRLAILAAVEPKKEKPLEDLSEDID